MIEKKKVCSFFVSEYHLLTILLPYINEKIVEIVADFIYNICYQHFTLVTFF